MRIVVSCLLIRVEQLLRVIVHVQFWQYTFEYIHMLLYDRSLLRLREPALAITVIEYNSIAVR